MFANKYIKKLRPYPVVSHKAWELSGRENILKLDWNEATVLPSPKVRREIENFLANGRLNWYPDINNKKIVEMIAQYSRVATENVQYFSGSDDLHEYIIGTFTEPEDRALVVSPTYDNFRVAAESRGVSVRFHRLKEPFDFQPDEFSAQVGKLKPKIVYICNPNNPTGTVYKTSEIKTLARSFPETLFIIDEAYYEFAKQSASGIAVEYGNIIISRTFSKAFALAGFRIGYAISSVENIRHLNKIRNPKNVTALSQIAAMAALDDIAYTMSYVNEVLETKLWLRNKLEEIKGKYFDIISGGGNFILLKMKPEIKENLIRHLLKANIFVRDYKHVEGMEGYLRLTIGTKEQMSRFLKEFGRLNHA